MKKFESLEKYKIMTSDESSANQVLGGADPSYINKYCTEKTLVIRNPNSGQGTAKNDNVWEGLEQD